MPSAQPAAAAAAGGVCCVHPAISNGDSATDGTHLAARKANERRRCTSRDGMLRFRLQGQVHFLRARIKGVADELTPAKYLVASPLA